MERGESIKAAKLITADEYPLSGHFPGEPIMPGVLTLEGIAQSALILLAESLSRGRVSCFLDRVDRVKFKRALVPGDRVEFLVRLMKKEGGFWTFRGQARIKGEIAAEADVIFKVALQEVGFEL